MHFRNAWLSHITEKAHIYPSRTLVPFKVNCSYFQALCISSFSPPFPSFFSAPNVLIISQIGNSKQVKIQILRAFICWHEAYTSFIRVKLLSLLKNDVIYRTKMIPSFSPTRTLPQSLPFRESQIYLKYLSEWYSYF